MTVMLKIYLDLNKDFCLLLFYIMFCWCWTIYGHVHVLTQQIIRTFFVEFWSNFSECRSPYTKYISKKYFSPKPVCLYVFLSAFLSAYLSACLFVCNHVFHLPCCTSVCLSVCLHTCLPFCLPTWLPACLPVSKVTSTTVLLKKDKLLKHTQKVIVGGGVGGGGRSFSLHIPLMLNRGVLCKKKILNDLLTAAIRHCWLIA